QEKKIFTVQGPYPIIRSLLRARGWVERKLPGAGRVGSRPEKHRGRQEKQLQEEKEEEEGERWDEDPDGIHDVMSHLVRDQVPYFIWTNRHSAVDRRLLRQDQVVNHYARVGAFTTKEGLCLNLRNLPWFDQADPDTFFPRCYRLGAVDERQAFIEDFRLTAARSLLKVALERAGDVPAGTEQPPKSGEGPGEHVGTVTPGGRAPPTSPQLVEEALQVCEQHLGSLGHQDIDRDPPSPRMTGTDWDRFLRDCYRVAHIFGTKFDVRQWFLVTSWNPLTVWFYRESYLRFCSRPFSLRRLDPARHLCNVSIQKQCGPLQAYLAQGGRADAWHQVMVPGMKAAVVGALRSAQDLVGSRKGSFELYGADFIFGEDCQPWLLEINASPTMAPSSAVTGRLCASVQRDTLRVVIDHRDDPTCPTGRFALIYK
ncbi:TTLL3 monoglycylase, partial [Ciconia maguari]|nr:TTLL3 monoglycylase [Ciconia maguari]